MLLVDTNVILDVVEDDPRWYNWSVEQLRHLSRAHELLVNPVIYAELACFFQSPQALDFRLEDLGMGLKEIPRMGLYFAGVAHRHYRQAGGPRDELMACCSPGDLLELRNRLPPQKLTVRHARPSPP